MQFYAIFSLLFNIKKQMRTEHYHHYIQRIVKKIFMKVKYFKAIIICLFIYTIMRVKNA
jgi:hypothetical protein